MHVSTESNTRISRYFQYTTANFKSQEGLQKLRQDRGDRRRDAARPRFARSLTALLRRQLRRRTPRRQNKKQPKRLLFVLVRVTGLEPAQPCDHKNLNLTRLPIPPHPHSGLSQTIRDYSTSYGVCQMFFCFFEKNFLFFRKKRHFSQKKREPSAKGQPPPSAKPTINPLWRRSRQPS